MAHMEWLPAWEVGFEPIDGDHRTLVETLNQLHGAVDRGTGREELQEVLTFLREYTISHFAREEALMVQHRYPASSDHFVAHADLVLRLSDIMSEFRSGETEAAGTMVAFLEDWLLEHILRVDRALGAYLTNRGVVA
jgi:hemerythrin-like metal-binding protein